MSDAKEDSIDPQRELLIRHLDQSLEDDEVSEVEHLIEHNEEACRELHELEALTTIIRENQAVFCPDPAELSDFLESGYDPSGTIAEHLDTCSTCRREMDTLRATCPHEMMPLDLFERIVAELPHDVAPPPVSRAGKRFQPLIETFTTLLHRRWAAVGAAALVLLAVFVMYPRDTTTPTIGVSSVSWNHIGNSLSGGLHAVRKPSLAFILLFEDFKKPLPQETVDELYQSLRPSQADRDRYEVVPPSKLTGIIKENKLQATDVPAILTALKTRLDGGEVVLVTVRAMGDEFTVQSKLIDTATGRVLTEGTADAASCSELKSTVRQAAHSLLARER